MTESQSVCDQKQLEIFQHNFNADDFANIKHSIKQCIEQSKGLDELMHQMSKIPAVQCVELAEDDDLEDVDFIPDYKNEEDGCCDFFVVLCYAELDVSKIDDSSKYAEVCFFIVYNDVRQIGWIDAATLAVTNNPMDYAKTICFFDIETYKPIERNGVLSN